MPQCIQLRLRLRPVDPSRPVRRQCHRPLVQQLGGLAVDPLPKAPPVPVLRAPYQAGRQRVALDLAAHDQQVFVHLDREGFEAALEDRAVPLLW